MEELFSEANPAPTATGRMPGQPEFNEEMPSEQEQAQYDQFVNRAVDFMGQQAEPLLATLNNKDRPVHEMVGELTVKIAKMVASTAKSAGDEIGPDVLYSGAEEIVEHLMELGDAGGIFPFKVESEEFDQTMNMSLLHAAKVAGEELISSPQYTPEMQDDAGNFMAQQIAAETERGEVAPGFHDEMGSQVAAATRRAVQGG